MSDKLDIVLAEVRALRTEVSDYATQTATNTADLSWLKRLVAGAGSVLGVLVTWLAKRSFNQ